MAIPKPDAEMSREQAAMHFLDSRGTVLNLLDRVEKLTEDYGRNVVSGKTPSDTAGEYRHFAEELGRLIEEFSR